MERDLKCVERLSLVDLSSEDDRLIASPSVDWPIPAGITSTTDKENADECCEMVQAAVQVDCIPSKKKATKFNLRKSLAWNSAFFTSEGILDPEELAMVNGTSGKAEPWSLPSVQEDMRKSFESTDSFESDCLTVESIESELFGNLRLSIKKFHDKSNETPTTEQPCRKIGLRTEGVCASKGSKPSSQIQGKPPMYLSSDSNEFSSSQQKVANGTRNQKLPPSSNHHKPVRGGAMVASIKMTSNPRPPPLGKNTKKTSGISSDGRRSSEASTLQGSQTDAPKSAIEPSHLTSSRAQPGRMLDQTRKMPSNTSRKKIDSKNSIRPSANTGLKSPATNAMIQKACLNLRGASPNSSFESVESSCSSTSTANTSTGSIPNFVSNDMGSHMLAGTTTSTSEASLQVLDSGDGSLKISRPSNPGNASSDIKQSKPSGLRIPLPKMGYFDAEKAVTRDPTKSHVVGSQGGLPPRIINPRMVVSGSGISKSKLVDAPRKSANKQPTSSSKSESDVAVANMISSPRFCQDQSILNNHSKESLR